MASCLRQLSGWRRPGDWVIVLEEIGGGPSRARGRATIVNREELACPLDRTMTNERQARLCPPQPGSRGLRRMARVGNRRRHGATRTAFDSRTRRRCERPKGARHRLRRRSVCDRARETRRHCVRHRCLPIDGPCRPRAGITTKCRRRVSGRDGRASSIACSSVRPRHRDHGSLLCRRRSSCLRRDCARSSAWRPARHRRAWQVERLGGGSAYSRVDRLTTLAPEPFSDSKRAPRSGRSGRPGRRERTRGDLLSTLQVRRSGDEPLRPPIGPADHRWRWIFGTLRRQAGRRRLETEPAHALVVRCERHVGRQNALLRSRPQASVPAARQ